MPTTTNTLGVTGLALLVAGAVVSTPLMIAGTTVVSAITGLYGWSDSANSDDKIAAYEDWIRIIRLHDNDGSIERLPSVWGPMSSGTLAGANVFVGEHGGVGWIDMTSGRNYWHSSDSFQPRQAKLVWVQDKNAPATAFPKTKLKMK